MRVLEVVHDQKGRLGLNIVTGKVAGDVGAAVSDINFGLTKNKLDRDARYWAKAGVSIVQDAVGVCMRCRNLDQRPQPGS